MALLSYTADDIVGADGDLIASLASSGTNTTALTAAGGYRPALVTGRFNGHQAMRFDGVGNKLTTAAGVTITAPFTIYVVLRLAYGDNTGNIVTNREFFGAYADIGLINDLRFRAYDGAAWHPGAGGITLSAPAGQWPGYELPFILAMHVDGASSHVTIHDGTRFLHAQTATDFGSPTWTGLCVGWDALDTADWALKGDIATLQVIEGAHDETATIDALATSYLPPVFGTDYIDERHMTAIGQGTNESLYLIPWRGALETLPAWHFRDGLGAGFNPAGASQQTVAFVNGAMRNLADHGITRARFEVGFNSIDYTTGNLTAGVQTILGRVCDACVTYGVRPLILLNANSGGPGPAYTVAATVPAGAAQGATSFVVSALDAGWSAHHTGVDESYQAHNMVKAIDAGTRTLTLDRGLASAITAGGTVNLTTLKYAPVNEPASALYLDTAAGWKAYVTTVATFVKARMGAGGFDMEVWNELSFASEWLNANNYYTNGEYPAATDATGWAAVLAWTSDAFDADAVLFAGVGLWNGISNTVPWYTSALTSANYSVIGAHPYLSSITYPAGETGQFINADFSMTTVSPPLSDWLPTFDVVQLEWKNAWFVAEQSARHFSPISTYDGLATAWAGRNYRVEQGTGGVVWMANTEDNITPADHGITDVDEGLALKAKAWLRQFVFGLNKGGLAFFPYAAIGTVAGAPNYGDLHLGVLLDALVDYLQDNQAYPAVPEDYTSPLLQVLSRAVAVITAGVDEAITYASARQLTVPVLPADTHNNVQWAGEAGNLTAHPPQYNRNLLAILPYQVTTTRFVIGYYVVTYDVRATLPEEAYTIQIGNYDGRAGTVRCYDPLTDAWLAVARTAGTATTITLPVLATDYPRLLVLDEDEVLPTTTPTSASSVAAGRVSASATAAIAGGVSVRTATPVSVSEGAG